MIVHPVDLRIYKLNVFADLSGNKLYIPKYVGLHFGNIKKYYYCVSKLLNEVLS